MQKKDEEILKKATVLAMCRAFNELMPDHLHIGLVPEWIPEHPECMNSKSKSMHPRKKHKCLDCVTMEEWDEASKKSRKK